MVIILRYLLDIALDGTSGNTHNKLIYIHHISRLIIVLGQNMFLWYVHPCSFSVIFSTSHIGQIAQPKCVIIKLEVV